MHPCCMFCSAGAVQGKLHGRHSQRASPVQRHADRSRYRLTENISSRSSWETAQRDARQRSSCGGENGSGRITRNTAGGTWNGHSRPRTVLNFWSHSCCHIVGEQTSRQGLQGKKMWGSCAEESCFYLSPNDTIATNTMDDRAEEYRRTQNRDN
jgi:hypothetical protein